jgi:hypothetical protein
MDACGGRVLRLNLRDLAIGHGFLKCRRSRRDAEPLLNCKVDCGALALQIEELVLLLLRENIALGFLNLKLLKLQSNGPKLRVIRFFGGGHVALLLLGLKVGERLLMRVVRFAFLQAVGSVGLHVLASVARLGIRGGLRVEIVLTLLVLVRADRVRRGRERVELLDDGQG